MPREPEQDVLARLEARLDRASSAAERLLAQARAPSAGGAEQDPAEDRPPASGWQNRGGSDPERGTADLDLLLGVLSGLRERVPAELQRRLAEALRELLLAVRALIDWYLERAERGPQEPSEVQDIPIS